MRTAKIFSFVSLFLVSVLLAAVLIGCKGGDDGGKETTEFNPEEQVYDALKGVTVRSGDSELIITVKDDKITVNTLKTLASGKNLANENAFCNLPQSYCTEPRAAKSVKLDWKYVSTEKYSEDGSNGCKITFEDKTVGLQYEQYIKAYTDIAGPFEFFGYVKNVSDADVYIYPERYFSVSVKGDSVPTVWSFAKNGWNTEGVRLYDGTMRGGTGIYKTAMEKGVGASALSIVASGDQAGRIPLVYVDYNTYGLYYAIEWTDCKITAITDNGEGDVTVYSGLASDALITTVRKGEAVYMPDVYVGVYDGDVDDGSNIYKHWFQKHKSPEIITENKNEPLAQTDACIARNASELTKLRGVQSYKWDYGWWDGKYVQASGNFTTKVGEGTVTPDPSFLADMKNRYGTATIPEFTAMLDKLNASCAMYFLLHDSTLDKEGVPTSVGKYGHPEWFTNEVVTGLGASADLGNTECVSFYQDYMASFFNDNGVKTWRSDFGPIAHKSDKENRHMANGNDVAYWCTVGFGELVDSLYNDVDGFRYESCSSGGLMKDIFTMTKAVVINCDDTADYRSLHASFYDSSYCIPSAQIQLPMSTHSFTKGSPYYTGTGDQDYGMRCAITGGVMIAKWNADFSADDLKVWPKYIANYYNKKIKPLIRDGELYHILPRPDYVHWDGIEYADPDSENELKGLVMLWKPTDEEGDEKTVFLRGLYPDTEYQLTFEDRPEQNCVRTGKDLKENGLTVKIAEDMGSEMIWITEAK